MPPRISVIIATYNRRALLAEVLRALEHQTVPRDSFEVIVVDDGSQDGTADWFGAQTLDLRCRLLRQANQGSSAARNAGIEFSRGRILVFLDDDFVPDPNLLEEHLRIHDSEPRVAVIGPASSLAHYREPWIAWQQATMERAYDAMAHGELEPSFREFWSGNCSVAREHILAVGGFDSSLSFYHDVELGYRLMKHGLSFQFNPSATGLHHSSHSFADWCATIRDYGPFSVRLFRELGEDEMLDFLARDWERRHLLTRWVVRRTVGHRERMAAVIGVLKESIRLGSLAPMSKFSRAVCAATANILYWDGVAQELGCGPSLCARLEARERRISTGGNRSAQPMRPEDPIPSLSKSPV